MGFGKLTEPDMNRALEHQREHGGYFGEALLALGLVNREELEWTLASQFDLPYVIPDADSVDPEAVALVSPEWALAHRVLPIMKTVDSVTAIVDSPLTSEPIEELRKRTGLEVEVALASSDRIRELIRAVYARVGAAEDRSGAGPPLSLPDFFGAALGEGAARMGISARGSRATGWYEVQGKVRRRNLTAAWAEDLGAVLDPPPPAEPDGPTGEWSATLSQGGMRRSTRIRYLASPAGVEYVIRTEDDGAALRDRFPPPPEGTLEEVRLLVRSGSGRFAVIGEAGGIVEEALPYLPSLLLGSGVRSVHVSAPGSPSPEDVFSVTLPADPGARPEALRGLRPFHFDAVTAALEGDPAEWSRDVLDLAPAVFVGWPEEVDGRTIEDTGIRWSIRIRGEEGGRLEWSLVSLER